MKDGFDAKAVAIYKQVHKIDAERQDVWEPLAELYQRMGLSAEAMVALQTAADAHHQAGRRREALDLLRKMASLDPTNTTSRLKVAELLRADGREGEAALEYREAASEFERQGEGEGAGAAIEKAIELQPDDAELYEQAVRIHLAAGSASRAEPLARRLIEFDEDAPAGYEQLAAVLQALGQEEALTDTYRRLAEAHRKRGEEDRARAILQRFVPIEPLSSTDPGGLRADLAVDAPVVETPDFGEAHDLEIDSGTSEDPPVFGDLPPLAEGPARIEQDGAVSPADDGVSLPDDDEVEADPDQLLAEASVYLRYGKHERAIASLQAVLAAEPRHDLALEKLGEAWTVAERPEEAVQAFVQAAELAREATDAERFDVLRGRVEALDAEAAAALGSLAPPDEPEPELEQEGEDEHGYLDDDVEFSLDDGLDDFGVEAPDSEAPVPEGPEAIELHDAMDEESEDQDATPASVEEREGGSGSHTTPQQIVDDFEAAEFYRQQGMIDEAEEIFRRVLELAPGHPQAMLRLGEIEAARAEAPQADATADEAGTLDLVAEAARETFVSEEPEPLEEAAPESTTAVGLAHELAADSFGLGDETPDPFGFDDEPTPPEPEPAPEAAPEPAAEPEPFLELVSEPDAEPEPDRVMAEPEPTQAEVTLPGVAPASDRAGAGSFDLAAELTDALEGEAGGGEASTEDEGFAALFHDFKRGVHETLGEGDAESRYDLGIAYREMGLVEDAYQEFLTALESPARRFDALHMLSISALDVGKAEDALPRLREALDEGAPEPQQPALRYDLGCLYEALGRAAEAIESFRFVAGIAPGFLDVEQRIESLVGTGADGAARASEPAAPTAHAPAGPADSGGFESFDDVVSEVEEEDASHSEPTQEPTPGLDPGAPDGASPIAPPVAKLGPGGFQAQTEAEPVAAPEPAPEAPPEPAAAQEPEPEEPDEDEAPERPRTRRRKISFF
jgi:tetratricopeptide (TPR) repeat protein